jgi:hypothetical protein
MTTVDRDNRIINLSDIYGTQFKPIPFDIRRYSCDACDGDTHYDVVIDKLDLDERFGYINTLYDDDWHDLEKIVTDHVAAMIRNNDPKIKEFVITK